MAPSFDMNWENSQRRISDCGLRISDLGKRSVDACSPNPQSAIRNPKSFLWLFYLVWLCPTWALAQQRPLITEDPRLIATGSFITEAGFGYFRRARFPVSGLGGDQFSALVNGLNFGLGPRAEFQINGVVQNFLRVHENGSGWRNDWGDISLSTKIKLVDETPVLPVVSFRPTVVLPNTDDARGIGSNSMQFFGNILAGKSVGPSFLYGNIGLGILTDTVRVRAQQDVLAYGIAAVLPISSRISLLSEWSGLDNPREHPTPGGEDRSQVRLGVQVRASGVRWDIGATAGLTRLDPRTGVVFGLTKEFRLWK